MKRKPFKNKYGYILLNMPVLYKNKSGSLAYNGEYYIETELEDFPIINKDDVIPAFTK